MRDVFSAALLYLQCAFPVSPIQPREKQVFIVVDGIRLLRLNNLVRWKMYQALTTRLAGI